MEPAMGKRRSFIFSTIVLFYYGLCIRDTFGCEFLLQEEQLTFLYSEVPEDYPINTALPQKLPLRRRYYERNLDIQLSQENSQIASNFIKTELNMSSNTIEFHLLRPLSEYRKEYWDPSLEFEFQLPGCAHDSTWYTFMLTIEDDNLYPPEFKLDAYNGLLTYSVVHGFKIDLNTSSMYTESSSSLIRVSDLDFNEKNGNITVTCNGSNCSYFKFSVIKYPVDKGFQFGIDVNFNFTDACLLNFKENVKHGETISFDIVATDTNNKYEATSTINLKVNLSSEIDTGSGASTGESEFPLFPVAGAGAGALLIIIACAATVVYQTSRNRKAKTLLRKLTEAEIREFLDGAANIGGNDGRRSVDVNTPIMAQPYNKNFEIPREKMRIDETTILGTGAFGIVWKGSIVFSNGEGITVAVKSVKRNVGVLYFKALLSELKIMSYIGKHPNIVSLVGACTHNIRKREVYIALEYCANGNFHNYLKCRRDRFSNLVVDGNLQLTNSLAYSYSSKGCFSKSVSTMDLLKWATQIANGLQYLESLGVIHGDLATRNVLLDNERVAKIGDFGLSRRLIDYSNYYYTKTSQTPLPWKWMAPESLKDMKFSKKSDIWSFGIILWEIFTLGQTPYPGLNWDETFLERLEKGMRPTQPAFASTKIYEVMVDCWQAEPHDRPDTLNIKRALENITSAVLRQQTDTNYMRVLGDSPYMTMVKEGEDGYLVPNHVKRNSYIEA